MKRTILIVLVLCAFAIPAIPSVAAGECSGGTFQQLGCQIDNEVDRQGGFVGAVFWLVCDHATGNCERILPDEVAGMKFAYDR